MVSPSPSAPPPLHPSLSLSLSILFCIYHSLYASISLTSSLYHLSPLSPSLYNSLCYASIPLLLSPHPSPYLSLIFFLQSRCVSQLDNLVSMNDGGVNIMTLLQWAFGIFMWELCTHGREPYADVDACDIQAYLESGRRLPKPWFATDAM